LVFFGFKKPTTHHSIYRLLVEIQKEGDHYEEQNMVGWIILRWILGRHDGMVWTGLIWLGIETSEGLL
jgi:hypothetical protein